MGFRFAFCLLGFGLAMEEALLPSNWLCISLCGCSGCRGGLKGRPRLRGRDLQPAVPFARLYARTVPGQEVRQRLLLLFSGLYAAMGISGPGIQLWPHSLTDDDLVCRSSQEPRLRRPRAHCASIARADLFGDGSPLGAEGPLHTSLVVTPAAKLRCRERGGSRKPGLLPSPGVREGARDPVGMRRWRLSLVPRAAVGPLGWAEALSPRMGRVGFSGFLGPP